MKNAVNTAHMSITSESWHHHGCRTLPRSVKNAQITEVNEQENKILDEGFGNNINSLSNYQLAGIINEKARYSSFITDQVKEEIDRRNISEEELKALSEKYTDPDIMGHVNCNTNRLGIAILVLFILMEFFISPIIRVVTGSIIIIASIKGVQLRFQKGSNNEGRIWKYTLFALAIIVIIIIGITCFYE